MLITRSRRGPGPGGVRTRTSRASSSTSRAASSPRTSSSRTSRRSVRRTRTRGALLVRLVHRRGDEKVRQAPSTRTAARSRTRTARWTPSVSASTCRAATQPASSSRDQTGSCRSNSRRGRWGRGQQAHRHRRHFGQHHRAERRDRHQQQRRFRTGQRRLARGQQSLGRLHRARSVPPRRARAARRPRRPRRPERPRPPQMLPLKVTKVLDGAEEGRRRRRPCGSASPRASRSPICRLSLRRSGATYASAKVASLSGTKTLKLKVLKPKKFKEGTYSLSAQGDRRRHEAQGHPDRQGQEVAAGAARSGPRLTRL